MSDRVGAEAAPGGGSLDAAALVGRAEAALEAIEGLPGTARDVANGAVAALVEVYGEGLRRVVDLVASRAPELAGPLVDDELVVHLLLLHGLHPDPLDVRVARALDQVRPMVRDHGGTIELDSVDGDVAVLRLRANGSLEGDGGDGPGLSPVLRQIIDEAVLRVAPELSGVQMVGSALARPHAALIPVEAVRLRSRSTEAAS
jgi:hypothetical protein